MAQDRRNDHESHLTLLWASLNAHCHHTVIKKATSAWPGIKLPLSVHSSINRLQHLIVQRSCDQMYPVNYVVFCSCCKCTFNFICCHQIKLWLQIKLSRHITKLSIYITKHWLECDLNLHSFALANTIFVANQSALEQFRAATRGENKIQTDITAQNEQKWKRSRGA